MYQKSVLPNGIRLVTEELPYFHSVAVGFWLTSGSRDESEAENGLSHFLEHMAFKGTESRTTFDIAREIDQLGGSCNAFTTKEATCFHARVMAAHLPRAVHLLGDLILHPLYREDDLERERQVILEEIYSQDDSPEDLVQVEFARHFWKGCSFGRPILGELETVASFSRADLLSFRQATYRPEQLVVAAAGRLRHQELVDFVAALFDGFANGSPPRPQEPVATHPGAFLFPRELEQVHVCLGAPGLSAGHRQRYGATVLQLLLGGNMSSRLFQVVREQLGLAYNIYSFMSFFSGHGLLGISAGVSPKHLSPLLDAVNRELSQLKREPVSEAELQAAQDYLKASLYLHAEDCDQRMMRLAKNEIHFGHYIPLEDIVAGLLRVTIPELQTLAQDFFQSDKWGLALLGPLNSGDLDKNTLSF